MKHYKVYVKTKDLTKTSIKINMNAYNKEEAKLGTQMMMRKRFGLELGRDYKITKTLQGGK